MLSFDIETEGLDWSVHRIAVACVYDPSRNIEATFNFLQCKHDELETAERINRFLKHLDDAPTLCCFNGVKFDVPFIQHAFKVDEHRVHGWMLKLFDIYEVCRLAFGSSCSLDSLLEVFPVFFFLFCFHFMYVTCLEKQANNYEQSKTASGLQAVEWIQNEDWDKVEPYCMMDTKLTRMVSVKKDSPILLPLSWPRRKEVAAYLEHEYDEEMHVHTKLDVFLRKL